MAQVLVIYDIVHDGTRTKISEICLDYGLDRVQYSAFEGQLRRTHQEELMLKVKKVLGKRPGDIRLIPICEKDWTSRLSIKNEGPDETEPSPEDGQTEQQKGKSQ